MISPCSACAFLVVLALLAVSAMAEGQARRRGLGATAPGYVDGRWNRLNHYVQTGDGGVTNP